MLIILEKRVRYKLLRLLRATIVATINSDKKTNNNNALDKMLVELLIFTKRSRIKEIEKIKDCKYYFINIDFLKRISCESKNKIEIRIESKCFSTIYLIIRLMLTKNFSNLCYTYICKIARYIELKFNDIRYKIISKRLKIY